MDRRTVLAGGLGVGALLFVGCRSDSEPAPSPTAAHEPSEPQPTETPELQLVDPRVDDTIATGLAVPWAMAFLADGSALVTQRDRGSIVRVTNEGGVSQVHQLADVRPGGEGGLQGIVVSPDESQVFVFHTTSRDNRVVRFAFDGDGLSDPEVIMSGLIAGAIHHGGALAWHPDGHLLVSVGDAAQSALAQDRRSRQGKILRITTDGDPAPGNPFGNRIWTWGHRNVEGLAFGEGQLWATEFGNQRFDELNLIEPGNNYGWPAAEGDEGPDEFTRPQVTWTTAEASPAGVAIIGGHAYVASLRGRRLWRVPLDGDQAGEPEDFFNDEFGRLRSVAAAPDGSLWLGTSNRDGRGNPSDQDDRILRIIVAE